MSFETISKPIETDNKQEHEKQLREKLRFAQIVFVVKKYDGMDEKTKPHFSRVVYDETNILSELEHRFSAANKLVQNGERVKEYIKNVTREIDEIAQEKSGDELASALSEYLIRQYAQFGEFPPEHPKESLGFIHFQERSGVKDLKNIGFSPDDDFLEVHFSTAFQIEDKKFGPKEIREELSKLAEIIIDRYPKTRAVIGSSWLLDNPATRRLGFKIVEDKKESQNGMATWLQLIDKNGQIDTDKLASALKTGHLPYRRVFGYIPVEEFLQKYLPDNRRGEVALQVVDKERFDKYKEARKKIREELENEGKGFVLAWDRKVKEDGSLDHFLEGFPRFMEIIRSAGLENEFMNLIKKAWGKKLDWGNFKDSSEYSPEYKEFSEGLKKKLGAEKLYVEKKIEIK